MTKKKIIRGRSQEKAGVSGSETVLEMLQKRTPWILGKKIRKPKIIFPDFSKVKKVNIPMPVKTFSVILIYAALFVLQTGIIYLLYRDPPALGATVQGEPQFLYQDLHESFIIEGIVASTLIFLCSLGYILLYHASKYVYNKVIAQRILILGIILILTTFIALQYMISYKIGVKTIFD
ncbi:MAG: hypothetical protein ACTSU4_15565 [Promethearchaeota archaeon]